MRRFSEEMDRLLGDFGFGSWSPMLTSYGGGPQSSRQFGTPGWHPAIEMFQRGDNLVVRADLPGLRKEDVKVEVQEDCLMIEGERKQEHEEKGAGVFRTERSYGHFARCVQLPQGIDPGKVSANFRDGVLEVTMPSPKQQETRGHRIEIK